MFGTRQRSVAGPAPPIFVIIVDDLTTTTQFHPIRLVDAVFWHDAGFLGISVFQALDRALVLESQAVVVGRRADRAIGYLPDLQPCKLIKLRLKALSIEIRLPVVQVDR